MVVTLTPEEEKKQLFTLAINGIEFNELTDAPAREREPLARSTTSINMLGIKKHGYYPILINGVLIPVSVLLNR